MGLGEHVDRSDALQEENILAQNLQVAGEGGRVTRDVDNTSGLECLQGLEGGRVAALPRWVKDYTVWVHLKVGERLFRAALKELNVGEASGVGFGVLHGGGGILDGDYPSGVGSEQQGKGAHAGVGVHQGLVA